VFNHETYVVFELIFVVLTLFRLHYMFAFHTQLGFVTTKWYHPQLMN